MMPHKTAILLTLLLATAISAGHAQQPAPPPAEPEAQPAPSTPPQPEQPVFRAGINFVRVDVIVTDGKGNPITDLSAEDFDVLEDGDRQTVESFKLIKVDGNPEPGEGVPAEIRTAFDEEREAARDDVRIFVIFLDDYHVRRGSSMRVRQPLIRFIENQLGPRDLLAVMYPLTSVELVSLTRNHQSVVRAIENFWGRKFDYTPRNEFEERYALYPATVVERIRNQVSLSALKALATHLGALREGRKTVIVVSEGYSNNLPPQLRDPIAAAPGIRNPNRGNPMATNTPREDSAEFFESMNLLSDLQNVFGAANRSNTSFYTLDPRGLAASEFDISENINLQTDRTYLQSTVDTLRVLADQTDGRAILNNNDLENGLKQVVRDASYYYLLGYNSTKAPTDGKFHEIKVRVKRPGVQVRARKGYWAYTEEDVKRATMAVPEAPAAVTKALGAIATPRDRLVRTWVGTERGVDGKTRVTFVWEPLPPVPGVNRPTPSLVKLFAAGNAGAHFRGDVSRHAGNGSEGGGAPAGIRAPAKVSFEAPPGPLQLRMSVEGARGESIDSAFDEIVVPDYTQPAVAVTPPAIVVVRNGIEFRNANTNPDAVPTPLREFRRTDRLLIRFQVYGPGDTAPAPTARLLNRGGTKMADLPVTPPANGLPHQVDLPLASLARGEYLIEIAAGEGEGATQLVAIRVEG